MRPVDVSGQIFLDETGRFPRFSNRGDSSVMVLYDNDSNAILTESLKNNNTSGQQETNPCGHCPPKPIHQPMMTAGILQLENPAR